MTGDLYAPNRLRGGNVYFLSYRNAAKACEQLDYQSAHTITLALFRAGVIDMLSKGKAGLKSRKAAEFRHLLPLNADVGTTDLQQ